MLESFGTTGHSIRQIFLLQGKIFTHDLKPIDQLYGEGFGNSSVDPLNSQYEPLISCIEDSILDVYENDEDLTDGLVLLTLDRMSNNPACEPFGDKLCNYLQGKLRMLLSASTYSRQEVKQALRVVSKSVTRHTRVGGITGYLDFISRML